MKPPNYHTEKFLLSMIIVVIKLNSMQIWTGNFPENIKIFIKLMLLNQAVLNANCVYKKGFKAQADAAMLWINDSICEKFGTPKLNHSVPRTMKILRLLVFVFNFRKLKLASR